MLIPTNTRITYVWCQGPRITTYLSLLTTLRPRGFSVVLRKGGGSRHDPTHIFSVFSSGALDGGSESENRDTLLRPADVLLSSPLLSHCYRDTSLKFLCRFTVEGSNPCILVVGKTSGKHTCNGFVVDTDPTKPPDVEWRPVPVLLLPVFGLPRRPVVESTGILTPWFQRQYSTK